MRVYRRQKQLAFELPAMLDLIEVFPRKCVFRHFILSLKIIDGRQLWLCRCSISLFETASPSFYSCVGQLITNNQDSSLHLGTNGFLHNRKKNYRGNKNPRTHPTKIVGVDALFFSPLCFPNFLPCFPADHKADMSTRPWKSYVTTDKA